MKKLLVSLALTVTVLLPDTALAWNNRGHMAVAAIAYEKLSTAPSNNVRAKVDALLRQHPDFQKLSQGLKTSDPNFGKIVFMKAATWPDSIRGDIRFFDSLKGEAAKPTVAGFPDMDIHALWHFINIPFSFDGTETFMQEGDNALTKIIAFRNSINNTGEQPSFRAYHLSWLLHVVGDIHQPLHSTAFFSKDFKRGDQGGNRITLDNFKRLHSFWDGLLGIDDEPDDVIILATAIMGSFQRDNADPKKQSDSIVIPGDKDPESAVLDWIQESATISKYFVYQLEGDLNNKPIASPEYQDFAEGIARHRVAIAGYRLAEIINDKLK